jgi:diguanylate cyclase (GGDEF)-like protein
MLSLRARLLLPLVATLLAAAVYGAAAIQHATATGAAERLDTAQRLLTGTLDQETGLRGYMLSGDPAFLQPYRRGEKTFEDALSLAHVQLASDRRANNLVVSADEIIEHWRALAEAAIVDVRARGPRRPDPRSLVVRKRLMDDFRTSNTALRRILVAQRDRDERRALWLSVGLSLAVFLLVGGFGSFFVTRRLRAQITATEAENDYRGSQAEFVQTLQAVDTEDEANLMLKRHIRQWQPSREVAVVNRNSSDNRLEAKAATTPALFGMLDGVETRACVAIRLGRVHEQRQGERALLSCELCGADGDALCSPLLVSGRVIGTVLARQPEPFDDATRRLVADSVSQAAPVLGNLRAVAMAESRAATDALTGLPNRRAVNDIIKRMAAQAHRTGQPLAALGLDLDRFKDINDRFGHEKGDEVLAAVAQVMTVTIRESDFAGRLGGEEFIILGPNTAREGALVLAEKVRNAIERVVVPGVSREITASLGVAVLPDEAMDADTLLRRADRALYAAKAAGRNRVESAANPRPAATGR